MSSHPPTANTTNACGLNHHQQRTWTLRKTQEKKTKKKRHVFSTYSRPFSPPPAPQRQEGGSSQVRAQNVKPKIRAGGASSLETPSQKSKVNPTRAKNAKHDKKRQDSWYLVLTSRREPTDRRNRHKPQKRQLPNNQDPSKRFHLSKRNRHNPQKRQQPRHLQNGFHLSKAKATAGRQSTTTRIKGQRSLPSTNQKTCHRYPSSGFRLSGKKRASDLARVRYPRMSACARTTPRLELACS